MAKSYNADSITVLEGLEAVRRRPGMYIGSIGSKGLNHLIYEIVQEELAKAFMEVLSCAGIFKRNPEGKEAFRRFTEVISKA